MTGGNLRVFSGVKDFVKVTRFLRKGVVFSTLFLKKKKVRCVPTNNKVLHRVGKTSEFLSFNFYLAENLNRSFCMFLLRGIKISPS